MLCNDLDFQAGNFSAKVLPSSVEKYTSVSDRRTVHGFVCGYCTGS